MKFPRFWKRDSDARINEGVAAPEDEVGMHGPSPVLDDSGKPFEAKLTPEDEAVLPEEVARPELIGYRSFWDQSVARGLTPEKLAGILQATKRGDLRPYLELAEEMEERDLHYLAVLSTRRRQVARIKPSIDEDKARGADKRIVDAVRDLVEAPEFRQLMKNMVDAFGKGFSVSEIVWTEQDGLWRPAAYVWRDPKYFTFDYISRSEVRLAEMASIDGVALPPAKFVIHKPAIKSGIPIRGGFAWLACWAWIFKQYALKDWVSFLDIFGMPIRLGKYHPSATADERRKLLQAVSRIAVDAAAIIPESMVIELLEAKSSAGGGGNPFATLGDYLDKQMSKAILGQTMTTDGQAGGLAQAKVHDEVRIDILEDDADEIAVTVNRDLIKWFVKLNFGDNARAPLVRFPVAEPQDIAIQATALAQLVPLGLKVSQQEVLDKIGFTRPEAGDELLTPPPGAAPGKARVDPDTSQAVRTAATARQHVRGCQCGRGAGGTAFNAEGVGAVYDDAIVESQELVDEALSDWREIADPLLAQLLRLADGASSLEEVLSRANAAGLDMAPLVAKLATATAISRGLGDVKD